VILFARSAGEGGAGEGEVDLFQSRAVDVEIREVKAATERPVAEHLQVDERALAVQDGQSSRPWLGERTQPARCSRLFKVSMKVTFSVAMAGDG